MIEFQQWLKYKKNRLSLILQETFYTKAVADPGFPRWGNLLFGKVFPKIV